MSEQMNSEPIDIDKKIEALFESTQIENNPATRVGELKQEIDAIEIAIRGVKKKDEKIDKLGKLSAEIAIFLKLSEEKQGVEVVTQMLARERKSILDLIEAIQRS